MKTLPPGLGLSLIECPFAMRVGLPLFPVRKSCGEPKSAVQQQWCNAPATFRNGRASTEVSAFSVS